MIQATFPAQLQPVDRKNAQSTSCRRSSTRTAPRDSRSMAIQIFSPSVCSIEHALRKYPSLVPHRRANDSRSAMGREFKYVRNFSMPSLYQTVQNSARNFYCSDIYPAVHDAHNPGMDSDVVATRRERLKLLIKERYGTQAKMVRAIGINGGELSALLRNKEFGEKKARKIESDAGYPAYWLDGLDAAPDSGPPAVPVLIDKWAKLRESQQRTLLAQIDVMIADNLTALEELTRIGLAPGKTKPQKQPGELIDPTLPDPNEFTQFANKREGDRRQMQTEIDNDRRGKDRRLK